MVKACRQGLRLEVIYASMNNPKGEERVIAPHTLVSSGYRWHVRAYCEKNRDYRDFILGRILNVSDVIGLRLDDPKSDEMWHQTIKLRLVPHPNLNDDQKTLIRHERCFEADSLDIDTRKATAIYMLHLLQVPTSKTDNPKANPLILENLEEINDLLFG